jgi:hypothetical protein
MAAEKLQPSGYRALAEVLKKFETEILTQWPMILWQVSNAERKLSVPSTFRERLAKSVWNCMRKRRG